VLGPLRSFTRCTRGSPRRAPNRGSSFRLRFLRYQAAKILKGLGGPVCSGRSRAAPEALRALSLQPTSLLGHLSSTSAHACSSLSAHFTRRYLDCPRLVPRVLVAAGTASPYPNRGSSFRLRFLRYQAAKILKGLGGPVCSVAPGEHPRHPARLGSFLLVSALAFAVGAERMQRLLFERPGIVGQDGSG
jgi:hypothetical protein